MTATNLFRCVDSGVRPGSRHMKAEFRGRLRHESSPLGFPLAHPATVAANCEFDYEYWNYALRQPELLGRIHRKLSAIHWMRLPRHAATHSPAS